MWSNYCYSPTYHRNNNNLTANFYLLLILITTIFISGTKALYCYQCIVFVCPSTISNPEHSSIVCNSVISFVQESLAKYYTNVKELTICPPNMDTEIWLNDFRQTSPTNKECPLAFGKRIQHPYCALGRLQVITTISYQAEDQSELVTTDVSSWATVMGCATRALANDVFGFPSKDVCPFWKFNSRVIEGDQSGLQIHGHDMELEQCKDLTNLCTIDYGAEQLDPSEFDYCILPVFSQVKTFNGNDPKTPPGSSLSAPAIFVIVGACILVFVGIVTCCGMYCENQ